MEVCHMETLLYLRSCDIIEEQKKALSFCVCTFLWMAAGAWEQLKQKKVTNKGEKKVNVSVQFKV